jgi:hypothetical protein
MKFKNKAQSLSVNTIIITILAVLVLVILIFIFAKNTNIFAGTADNCETRGNNAKCFDSCDVGSVPIPGTNCDREKKDKGSGFQVCCSELIKVDK